MDDLQYKMVMALNAADIGTPLCEQVAGICAEIAGQHCAQLHVDARTSGDVVPEIPMPVASRSRL